MLDLKSNQSKQIGLLTNLSSFRSHLMGISMLMIMAFHTAGGLGIYLGPYFFCPFLLFDVGVEFFIILSAIGCYYSLLKNPDPLAFYKRRIVRLLPTFFVCVIISGIFGCIVGTEDLYFFTNFFFLPLFEGDIVYWFIGYIIICYLLMPMLFNNSSRVWFVPLSFILSILIFILAWENSKTDTSIYNVLICRFPIYWLSIPIAKSIFSGKNIRSSNVALVCISILLLAVYFFIAITLKGPYYKYLSYLFMSVPALLILGYFISMINAKWILQSLAFIGTISLELYLLHAQLILPITDLIVPNNIILRFVISYSMAILLAYVVHQSVAIVRTKLSNLVSC